MNIKQTITAYLFATLATVCVLSFAPLTAQAAKCAGVEVSILKCDKEYDNKGGIETNAIWWLLQLVIRIFTAGIGVVAVGGIVYGSILYASAGGNTEQVKKGIKVIRDVVVGLILFVSMWAILEFLIPGGIFAS